MQATSNCQSFLQLTKPVHLPTLTSPSGDDSPHLPTAHHSQSPEVLGITDIAPERQGVDLGQVDYFKIINNDNELFKNAVLCVRLDALTAAGGGANPRYVDDILCAAIEKIEFTFGGNVLQELYGDEIHFRMFQETPEEELMRRCHLQGANLTPVERAALATTARWYYLELPFWWTRQPGFNWHQYAFQRLTRIQIHWRPATFLLQQDLVNARPTPTLGGNYILDHYIRFHVSSISEATKQLYMKMVEDQGDKGWLYMINDFERVENHQLSAGQTTHNVLLNTFTKFGYNLRFWIRPVANLQPSYLNNRRWECLDIRSLWFEVSGKRYFPQIDVEYLKYMFNAKQYLGNPELPVYNVPFTEYPDMHTHAMGGFDFSNTVNPTLTLITDALPANCFLDCYLFCHNYVRLVLRGNMSAAETVQSL